MRLLVTGATGRVGSRLVPRLLKQSYAVRVLLRHAEQAAPFRQLGAEISNGDLLQPDTLASSMADVDVVIHLAAFFRGATEEQARAANYDGTLALAQRALKAGVDQFIFVSTNLVYGPGRGRPAREDDEPLPLPGSFYAATKLAAERALWELQQTAGLNLCILRLAFVYGDSDPHLSEAARWARSWPASKKLQMVHHADVAQAVQRAIDTPAANGTLYNVADDEPVSTADILQLAGQAVTDEARQLVPEDPWEGIVDTARIRHELGFQPIYSSMKAAQEAGVL